MREVELQQELEKAKETSKLDLSFQQLTSMPSKLANIRNLKSLDLSHNQLRSLPPELGQLNKLVELDLSYNQLENLPLEIGQLKCLVQLNLRCNPLKNVPAILWRLQNLAQLDLRSNQLRSLPPELGQLHKLVELDVSNNQLLRLPLELGNLRNLTQLVFDSTEFANVLPSICAQGTPAILANLRAQLQADQRQWVSKLLVVGEGGVGKTSLLRALRSEPFDYQELTTHGIDIEILELSHPHQAGVTMQLNTWDFGGQDIYHATHQFFLTNRSLFIVVWNARLGFKQGRLTYWLKTIRANAPDAPILIVATHIEERDADLPLSELKKQFPKIINHYSVSNRDEIGIEELKQSIANSAARLPLMGAVWAATWLQAANTIRQLPNTQKYSTPNTLWQLMNEQNVEAEGQPILANMLHELGDILFYEDNEDLNELVIFKPQWVTEYISKVLEDDDVISSQGIFTRQCMNRIWSDLALSLRIHFLRLMERFDLSYKIPESKDISLVVERLSFEPPNYHDLWESPTRRESCTQLSMKFQLSEILPGIPTWFIARQHRFTTHNHWRTGVLLADGPNHKHLGLVTIERDPSTNVEYLQLTVRGPMPYSFFNLLKEGIEVTLHRYPGLKVNRFVPCPDLNNEGCLHEFNYNNLIKRLERIQPKKNIECPNCLEDVYVPHLLFGLHPTTEADVFQKLDKLSEDAKKGFNDLRTRMESGFNELRELQQREFLRQFRNDQHLPESYWPNVFALRPDDRNWLQKDVDLNRIHLQLYCQAPGQWHPTSDPEHPTNGLYTIDVPKQWLQAMAPHVQRLVKVFKYATPLVSPVLGVALPDIAEAVKADVALMNALVTKLPEISDSLELPSQDDLHEDKIEKLSGAALRSFRHFLDEKIRNSIGVA